MKSKQASSESVGESTSIKPVQRRLLVPLAVVLLLLVGGFSLVLVSTYKNNLDQSSEQVLEGASDELAEALVEQSEALAALEEVFLRDAGLRDALKERDRERLLADYGDVFAQLRQDHGITHFYFHSPDRVNLLRVHKPEKHGDLIDRFTAREAERTGKTASGVELGPLGTFTLRVVRPVFDGGTLIGYLELGKEIEDILAGIHGKHDVELAVGIHKSALDRAKWEAGMKMLGREADWDHFPDDVLIYTSMPRFPSECEPYVDEASHTYDDVTAEAEFDGKTWRVMTSPLEDDSGAEVGYLIVMNDISEAKAAFKRLIAVATGAVLVLLTALIGFLYVVLRRTDQGIWKQQEALRESEKKYRNLVNNTADLFYRTDMKGKIIFVSPSVHRLSGYTAEEAIGMKMAEEVYANLQERAIFLSKIQEDGYIENFEAQLKRKDGSIWWVSSNAHFFKDQDGNIKGVEGITRDITSQKKSEKALKESEARLKKAQSVAKLGNWEYDISTGKIWGSEQAFRIYGIERTSPYLPLDRVEACTPDTPRVHQALVDLIQENKRYDIEFEVQQEGSGQTILIHSIAELVYENGMPAKVLGVIQDVTEQKKAEEERKDLEDQLQHAQKMEAIGMLAGGVAHDLNNILGGLVSYPELLLLQLPEDSPLRESILTIKKSGEKVAAIVQDLLTLARRGVVVNQVVNLNDVIADYLKSPEHEKLQSYHPGVHLETHLDQDILNILGSSTHVSKTVMNLVSNAAEAMPEGGNITLSTENRYIDRPIRDYDDVKEGDYVVLTIADTGTGISPDDIGKIFEPFYTKKKMGRSGTGLGMAVVWGTVKDHNGYIDVQSTEGKGTTFTLYFPVTREKLPEDESDLAIESYSGNGESVLIVDDVEEQRQIASGMLIELGYSVVSVPSGEEAVEYLKTNKVDLLLLDMIMDPGMDGLDTYKKILELHPVQKAIIASGFSETDRVKEVQSLGAGAYIGKPLLLEKIGLAVKEELEN